MTDSGGYLTHPICEILKTTGSEGYTLEECTNLRNQIQDLIDNKLVQFNNAAKPNVITNPLPPHQEGNVNALSIVEERIPDFSSSSFPNFYSKVTSCRIFAMEIWYAALMP